MWVDRWIRGQAGTHTARFYFFMSESTVLVHVLCADFSQGGSQERVAWFVSSIDFFPCVNASRDQQHRNQ